LPLEFLPGASAAGLGLTGRETFTITGCGDLQPRETLRVEAVAEDGEVTTFNALARVDSPVELEYLRHGGILQMVLRRMMAAHPAD
jgi:aconitate hydratase